MDDFGQKRQDGDEILRDGGMAGSENTAKDIAEEKQRETFTEPAEDNTPDAANGSNRLLGSKRSKNRRRRRIGSSKNRIRKCRGIGSSKGKSHKRQGIGNNRDKGRRCRGIGSRDKGRRRRGIGSSKGKIRKCQTLIIPRAALRQTRITRLRPKGIITGSLADSRSLLLRRRSSPLIIWQLPPWF